MVVKFDQAAVRSAPLLFAYAKNRFSHYVAHNKSELLSHEKKKMQSTNDEFGMWPPTVSGQFKVKKH